MFTATFKCVEKRDAAPQVAGDANPKVASIVTLQPDIHDKANASLWEGEPNGAMQLGRLPPFLADLFKANGSYRVTVEPL